MDTNTKRMLIGAAVAVALGAGCFPDQALAQPVEIESSRIAKRIIGETNRYRASQGAAPLAASEPLMLAAQRYADYLAQNLKEGHRADGRSPGQRIAAAGYKACTWSENLFVGAMMGIQESVDAETLPAKAMEFWKPRPGYAKNLRDPRVKNIGVGVAAWTYEATTHTRIVQVFGDDCGQTQPPAPAACASGFEPRFARPADRVCVTPFSRALVAKENGTAAFQVNPRGAYGPNTCLPGLVWREAFDGDVVCVTAIRRAEVKKENQLAASRVR